MDLKYKIQIQRIRRWILAGSVTSLNVTTIITANNKLETAVKWTYKVDKTEISMPTVCMPRK